MSEYHSDVFQRVIFAHSFILAHSEIFIAALNVFIRIAQLHFLNGVKHLLVDSL